MKTALRKLLKERLSPTTRTRLKNVRDSMAASLAYLFSRTGWLAATYYLFQGSYFREQQANLAGKSRHMAAGGLIASTNYRLRRNIHRIEKGLVSRPRRATFAKSYILDTVEALRQTAAIPHAGTSGEVKWAFDVLNCYFDAVDIDEGIAPAYDLFNSIQGIRPHADMVQQSIPRPRSTFSSKVPVDPNDFMNLCLLRRSVRWFLPDSVPRSSIDAALLAAGQAPSACNRLPYQFRFFDDPDAVKIVSNLPAGTSGFSHNFPAIAVLVGDLAAYTSERDRHLIYIDASLAAMSFMLALETHGLSSCPINWADDAAPEGKMRELLRLGQSERVVMLIAVGYADPTGGVAASEKRGLSQLREYNPPIHTAHHKVGR